MMSRKDRLDSLLTALARSTGTVGHESAAPFAGYDAPPSAAGELPPLLAAARDLAQFAHAQPDPRFAAELRARMLVRAAARRQQGITPLAPAPLSVRHTPRQPAWRTALIAAAALVALGVGAVAGALAAPGSALFGMRQIEQNIGLGFMDHAGRAQAHLRTARQWLADLRTAAGGQGSASGLGAYSAILRALRAEDAAAAQEIQQVPPGSARTTLQADLAALHRDERTAFMGALPTISWPDRIATTQALAALGVSVPRVARASVIADGHGMWQVTLVGSGFQPGAVLLIDGRPQGSVTSVTSTQLVASAQSAPLKSAALTLGVGNPDGTAAVTATIQRFAAPTATPNDHGSNGSNGPHGPTTPTPGAKGSGSDGSNSTNSGDGSDNQHPIPSLLGR